MSIIKLGDREIKRGSNAYVELFMDRLPSGTEIHLPIHVFRSTKPGPVVLLSGGLHGDEVNGIEIVRRLVASKAFNNLKCGSIIAMPIINIFGFLNFSREVPDGKDVNRSFPGVEGGSLASFVAHTISNYILPQIDFGIDFHTGGASRTNYPQVRFDPEDQKARSLSRLMELPVTLESPIIMGSLRDYAKKLGKSILVYEGGESMRFDEFAIDEAIRGTLRLLKHHQLLVSATKPKHKTRYFSESKWIRADVAGLFHSHKKSGQLVAAGDKIGTIADIGNQYEISVEASENGFIIGHNNMPVVNKGDALFHIGLL